MKEAAWGDCIKSASARKVQPDPKRADSLVETANERLSLISEITEKNCNFFLRITILLFLNSCRQKHSEKGSIS